MTKQSSDPREQKQQDQQAQQQAQQEVNKSQQRAEEAEVAGRHRQDGQKDHKGADKGPRGQ